MKWSITFLILLVGTRLIALQQNTATSDDVAVVIVPIKGFQYNGGMPLTVKAGQRVIWVNQDKMQHTASGNRGEFDTGILQAGEASQPVTFLTETGPGGIAYHCNVHDGMSGKVVVSGTVPPTHTTHHESPSVHSMVVMGVSSLFLSHIALFNDDNHSYQVTLEAQLDEAAAREAYAKYRQGHPDDFINLDPENFLLGELQAGRRSFKGTFSDTDGTTLSGLQDVKVNVVRIIQFRAFDPNERYPDRLTYQVIGNSSEVFLVNQISEAPNFQHVLKVKGIPAFLTSTVISSTPLITIPSKQLLATETVALKTATLANSSHLVLSPPAGTLNPREPLSPGDEVDVLLPNDSTPHKITIEKSIFFDVRILNK